jgi:hypothetical protein
MDGRKMVENNFQNVSNDPAYRETAVFAESPRDASSKDSPASQADSGVFSIASSNSPSKVDGSANNEETSPESLNRDRMAGFSERDLQCKSSVADFSWCNIRNRKK